MINVITPEELEATKEVIYAAKRAIRTANRQLLDLQVTHFNATAPNDGMKTSRMVKDIEDLLDSAGALMDDLVMRVKTPQEAAITSPASDPTPKWARVVRMGKKFGIEVLDNNNHPQSLPNSYTTRTEAQAVVDEPNNR